MRASYDAEQASFGDEIVAHPEYREAELTAGQFIADFRTRPEELGLDGETVRTLSVAGRTGPGNTLIVKDADTLLFLWDVNYYEMKRAGR